MKRLLCLELLHKLCFCVSEIFFSLHFMLNNSLHEFESSKNPNIINIIITGKHYLFSMNIVNESFLFTSTQTDIELSVFLNESWDSIILVRGLGLQHKINIKITFKLLFWVILSPQTFSRKEQPEYPLKIHILSLTEKKKSYRFGITRG